MGYAGDMNGTALRFVHTPAPGVRMPISHLGDAINRVSTKGHTIRQCTRINTNGSWALDWCTCASIRGFSTHKKPFSEFSVLNHARQNADTEEGMDIRKHVRLLLPLTLSGGIALMAFQFFFGKLGVVESWEKQRTIAALQQDIAAIKTASAERQTQISLLSTDKGTIRGLALLYGMTGGDGIPARPLPQATKLKRESLREDQQEQPFLLRHPVLIIIPGVILALLTGFMLSRRLRKQDADPQRTRYIKPSWTA